MFLPAAAAQIYHFTQLTWFLLGLYVVVHSSSIKTVEIFMIYSAKYETHNGLKK
jgi:hypothetical protein